jgi:hypothetical protein
MMAVAGMESAYTRQENTIGQSDNIMIESAGKGGHDRRK